jgi:hypothetical protein
LGLVGGTAYNEWSKSTAAQVAQARGDALLDALDMDDDTASIAALSEIATNEGGDVVASFLAAGADQSQAANLLGAIAANTDHPEYIRDLARLKLATTPDAVSQDAAVLILTDLSAAGGLYRNAATEILVAIELERGNVDAAVTLLQAHIQDAQATQEQIQRMGELIMALGATPELAN